MVLAYGSQQYHKKGVTYIHSKLVITSKLVKLVQVSIK